MYRFDLDKIKAGLFGLTGVTLTEMAHKIDLPSLQSIELIVKLVIEVIIGVSTIYGIIKSKRNKIK